VGERRTPGLCYSAAEEIGFALAVAETPRVDAFTVRAAS
jgi:hypothetical protein